MDGLFANSYDVVLAIWGLVWIAGGAAFIYVMHRAIQAENKSYAVQEGVSSKVEKAEATHKELVATGR